jgi:glutathione S-transferase
MEFWRFLERRSYPLSRDTCPNCWRVQKALDEQGIEYELATGPFRPGKREELARISGQRKFPTIEFEDGSTYREESAEMVKRIEAGQLFQDSAGAS